jgi:capsular polysaccharide biosynthesis protein
MLLRQQETGEFENEAMMADFAKTRELETVDVYGMTPEAQIALFAEAELLVASHGPVLANLLFAQAGTKVLEIAPDESFRPYYWRLAGKLGLAYAVLPTPTTGRGLDGALRVSAERLRSLYRMLNSRL